MHCFICNSKNHYSKLSLDKYEVPICSTCSNDYDEIKKYYLRGRKPFYAIRQYNSSKTVKDSNCYYCKKVYSSDNFIGNSFSRNVCKVCQSDSKISLEIRNICLKYTNIK